MCDARLVFGNACVVPLVWPGAGFDKQKTRLGADAIYGNSQLGHVHTAVESPGDVDGQIPLRNEASDLRGLTRKNGLFKRKGNDSGMDYEQQTRSVWLGSRAIYSSIGRQTE